MTLTIGELKEFIADLPEDAPVLIDSIQRGDKTYGSETLDVSFADTMDGKFLSITPATIEVSGAEDEW